MKSQLQARLDLATSARLLTEQALTSVIATPLPLLHWPAHMLKHFHLLQKLNSTAQRDFDRALATLTSYKEPPPPKPEEEEDEEEEDPYKGSPISQNFFIHIDENGQTITESDFPAAKVYERNVFSLKLAWVMRQFFFRDAIIPPEYDWIRFHNGVEHPPAYGWKVIYNPTEFERMTELEVLDPRGLARDGERLHHERYIYAPPKRT